MSTDSNSIAINIDIDEGDFFSDQGPFLPISICIDTSSSMRHYEDELKRGFAQFFKDILDNDTAKRAALLQVITFDDKAIIVREYAKVTENSDIPPIVIGGQTNLVDAVTTALDSLNTLKKKLKEEGASYYQPWLVLLTDGCQFPEDQPGIDSRSAEVRNLCGNEPPKLVCFPIGIGDGVNWNDLKRFSADDYALTLKDNESIKKLFKFISQTVGKAEQLNGSYNEQDLLNAFNKVY